MIALPPRKSRIRAAFSAAASGYEAVAGMQDRVAAGLARRLTRLTLPPGPVLEVGCGTGLLTRRLAAPLGPQRPVLATDLSPAMVAQTRAGLAADSAIACAVMDAEAPAIGTESCALVVSSLAAQWFTDLPAAVATLAGRLVPGGHLLLTLPGAGSFSEWTEAHHRLGFSPGTPDFPTAEAVQAMLPPGGQGQIETTRLIETHPDALSFVRAVAALGAGVPRPGHRPLTPGQLRRVIAALGEPCRLSWVIHTLIYTREGGPA